jgi:hypothetical protein
VSPIATTCGPDGACTGEFAAQGTCDGHDQIAIQQPWEKADVTIHQVVPALRLDGAQPTAGIVQVGNSAQNDIMAIQVGTGATPTRLDPPFKLPARIDAHTHVDAHITCWGRQHFQVMVLLYYSIGPVYRQSYSGKP